MKFIFEVHIYPWLATKYIINVSAIMIRVVYNVLFKLSCIMMNSNPRKLFVLANSVEPEEMAYPAYEV